MNKEQSAAKMEPKKIMMPKELLGISDEMAEAVYRQAYTLYNAGKYEDASQLFRMLIMLNPAESKYLLGLAASYHMMKLYKSAVDTYALCATISADNPIPYYHSADCYLKLDDKVSACVVLELAIKRAADKPQFRMMRDRATLTLEGLKNELKKK